jgi:hypothetical protein
MSYIAWLQIYIKSMADLGFLKVHKIIKFLKSLVLFTSNGMISAKSKFRPSSVVGFANTAVARQTSPDTAVISVF